MTLMNENDKIREILTREDTGWLNFEAGAALFGGNLKLYVKIIKTFADNIGPHIDKLRGLTPESLADYAITVHGVKGSLYGIGANREGDMAFELEMAAKMGSYDKVCDGNGAFVTTVEVFTDKLRTLLAKIDCEESGGQKRPGPDKTALGAMLSACREFDAIRMQEILQELEQYEYEKDGELVKWLGEQVTAFGYDKIVTRLASFL